MATLESTLQNQQEKKITRQKYFDPIQGEVLGYASAGRVYEDEGLTTRIAMGSVVPTKGGVFMRTAQGSVRLDEPGQGEESLLSLFENQRQGALTLADNAARQGILAKKPAVESEYDRLARSAYQTFRTGQAGLANRLASAGLYNSGYADTLAAGHETAYLEQVSENERARASALANIEQELLAQQTKRQIAEQELAAEAAKLRLSQHNTAQSLAQKAEENRLAEEWRQKNFDASQENLAWNRAYTLEKDAKAEAAAAEAAAAAAAKAASKTTGTSSTSPKAPAEKPAALTALQKAELNRDANTLAATYFASGNQFQAMLNYLGSDSVQRMYESKYGASGYGFLVEETLNAYEKQKNGGTEESLSLSAAQVQALASSLLTQLAAGGITPAKLAEYVQNAGFDKNTKTLLELYLSGANLP